MLNQESQAEGAERGREYQLCPSVWVRDRQLINATDKVQCGTSIWRDGGCNQLTSVSLPKLRRAIADSIRCPCETIYCLIVSRSIDLTQTVLLLTLYKCGISPGPGIKHWADYITGCPRHGDIESERAIWDGNVSLSSNHSRTTLMEDRRCSPKTLMRFDLSL
jgi:hypothetical protein